MEYRGRPEFLRPGPRKLCTACGMAPTRAPNQSYCRRCASAKDKASARARRAELKALREEIKALRERLKREAAIRAGIRLGQASTWVSVPDEEC